jgi:hypothetical protein
VVSLVAVPVRQVSEAVPQADDGIKATSINYFFKSPPVISLVAVPVRQVGEAVPQADDGIEAAFRGNSTQVSHQAHPVRFLYHPAGN